MKDRNNYVLHFKNLQKKNRKVHRGLAFYQSPWLKRYIDFNTDMRKNAAKDLEKDFFKLMNNSVLVKTMENVRKRVDVRLVMTKKCFWKWLQNQLLLVVKYLTKI